MWFYLNAGNICIMFMTLHEGSVHCSNLFPFRFAFKDAVKSLYVSNCFMCIFYQSTINTNDIPGQGAFHFKNNIERSYGFFIIFSISLFICKCATNTPMCLSLKWSYCFSKYVKASTCFWLVLSYCTFDLSFLSVWLNYLKNTYNNLRKLLW